MIHKPVGVYLTVQVKGIVWRMMDFTQRVPSTIVRIKRSMLPKFSCRIVVNCSICSLASWCSTVEPFESMGSGAASLNPRLYRTCARHDPRAPLG